MWFKILLVPKNMVIITKTWSLVPHDRWCKNINDENVVVINLVSTTTYCSVVEKLTTGNITWSLIVLTTKLLMTMDDHVRTFNDHRSRR